MNISNGLCRPYQTDAQPKSNTHTFSIKQMNKKQQQTNEYTVLMRGTTFWLKMFNMSHIISTSSLLWLRDIFEIALFLLFRLQQKNDI